MTPLSSTTISAISPISQFKARQIRTRTSVLTFYFTIKTLCLQCFMPLSFLTNKTYLNSLESNTCTFKKLSLSMQPNIISIFVKNMQKILWGKCQENTIKFLEKIFSTLKIGKLWVLLWVGRCER